jgi:hypothetical protein
MEIVLGTKWFEIHQQKLRWLLNNSHITMGVVVEQVVISKMTLFLFLNRELYYCSWRWGEWSNYNLWGWKYWIK